MCVYKSSQTETREKSHQRSEEASARPATTAATFDTETLLDNAPELDPDELLDDDEEDLVAFPIGFAT